MLSLLPSFLTYVLQLQRVSKVASDKVAATQISIDRSMDFAFILCISATRMKIAARRWIQRAWDIALQKNTFHHKIRIWHRNRGHQSFCIGMSWVQEHLLCLSQFDNLS